MKIAYDRLTFCTTMLLGSAALPLAADASGFRLPEISVAGIGKSNALVADTKSPGALPYNPAAMAFHEKGQASAGLILALPDVHVTPDNGTTTDSKGAYALPIPSIFVSDHFNKQWSGGIAVNSPFGLETKWPAGTFQTFSDVASATSTPLIAALEPEHSKLEMLNFNPGVAFQPGTDTSLAFGIDYYVVRNLTFNTQSIKIEGDGSDLGWNIGIQHVHDAWSFGLSYRSSVVVNLNGTVDATAVGALQSSASAKLKFPSLLQVGARYAINPDWALEFDLERTGWSSFDVVNIKHASGLPSPITSTNNWDNALAYRLGADFRLSPKTQLRFGYALDKTPQGDDYFTARLPGNDRQTLSAGFAHTIADWTLEGGYMYIWLNDRTVSSSRSYLTGVAVDGNTDPNGTDAFNGKYQSSAQMIGLSVSTQF
jgi:long-chain fatty acid transport protein